MSRISWLVFALSLGACSAIRPPGLPLTGLERLPEGAISVKDLSRSDIVRKDLVHALTQRSLGRAQHQDFTLLALSGGGANGAFGAGVINAWTDRGDRPEFDVVTGVSTGALMAPLVFLGPHHDATLTKLYTSMQASRIYLDRPLATVVKEMSLKDPGPLRALIRELVTDEFVEDIALEHKKGRRLLIGTTDLDLQRTVVWDVGAIARERSPDKVAHIRDILLASSSVPLLFPPVYFNVAFDGKVYQQMHVDGGIESPLLVPGLLTEFDGALRDAGINRKDFKVRLYALVNQQVEVENTRPVDAGMVAMAVATINHSQRSNLASNLARLRLLSQTQGVEMKVLVIPSEIRLERDSLAFDQAEMKTLYEVGLKLGASDDAWK